MTTEENLDRLTNIVGDIGDGLARLTNTVDSLASTVVAHDNQIDSLIKFAEIQKQQMAEQRDRMDRWDEQSRTR